MLSWRGTLQNFAALLAMLLLVLTEHYWWAWVPLMFVLTPGKDCKCEVPPSSSDGEGRRG